MFSRCVYHVHHCVSMLTFATAEADGNILDDDLHEKSEDHNDNSSREEHKCLYNIPSKLKWWSDKQTYQP